MLRCDDYLTPDTLADALRLLADAPDGSRVVAGATDTLPWARQGRAGDVAGDVRVPTLIDITRIDELSGYTIDGGRVRMGAGVVFQQFLEDETLKAHLPNMPFCAIWFADDQIRRQATLAGNLVNASPAADGTPPMVALNGEVELARLDGDAVVRRTVPAVSFITGPGKTVLEAGEIITAVTCDSLKGYGGAFEKVGQRRSLVISVACATCCVKPSADGAAFEDVRLALGGVGPAPMRLDDAEAFLRGKPIAADVIAEAVRMSRGRVASRTRRDYREDVVQGFVERSILDALSDCGVAVGETPVKEAAHG